MILHDIRSTATEELRSKLSQLPQPDLAPSMPQQRLFADWAATVFDAHASLAVDTMATPAGLEADLQAKAEAIADEILPQTSLSAFRAANPAPIGVLSTVREDDRWMEELTDGSLVPASNRTRGENNPHGLWEETIWLLWPDAPGRWQMRLDRRSSEFRERLMDRLQTRMVHWLHKFQSRPSIMSLAASGDPIHHSGAGVANLGTPGRASFWREMARRFREARPAFLVLDAHTRVPAGRLVNRWNLSGPDRERFRNLAILAGRELDTAAVDPFERWMDHLSTVDVRARPRLMFMNAVSGDVEHAEIRIEDVFEASARAADRLEVESGALQTGSTTPAHETSPGEPVRPVESGEQPRRVHPIRAFRIELGWSQDRLAKEAGVNKNQIGRHERFLAKPSLSIAKVYADTFTKHLGRSIGVESILPRS